jgi:FkbM family methyltransferase
MNLYYTIKRKIIKQTLLNLWFVRHKCRKIWLGGEGCGFYVCPDILPLRETPATGTEESRASGICYSAGVGDDTTFDVALHERFVIDEIHLFDPTPTTIDWIARQELPHAFHFHPYGLSGVSGTNNFYLSEAEEASSSASSSMIADGNKWVSKERNIKIQVMSLADIAKMNGHKFVDVLKMDIEGSEFDAIESLRELDGVRFGQICVEFHQRFFPNHWRVLRKAIKTLSDCGYLCFAVNWNMMEYSFINTRADENMRK